MATIESQIGSVVSSQRPMKKYTVDDPTLEPEELKDIPVVNPLYLKQRAAQQQEEQEIKPKTDAAIFEKYEQAKINKNKISKDGKSKIEALLGLKKITKSITIDGIEITLKNLTGNGTRLAFKTIEEHAKNNIDIMFYSRHVYLALSLYKIEDQDISVLLGEGDEPNVDLRLSLIEELSEDTIKDLQDFYEKEIGIKSPITEGEVKEVNSDIKK